MSCWWWWEGGVISMIISSIKSLQMWSCKLNPILPISRLSPHVMSLHTSFTLSLMALLLRGGDATLFIIALTRSVACRELHVSSVIFSNLLLGFMNSPSSPGLLFRKNICCRLWYWWWACVPSPPISYWLLEALIYMHTHI